MIFYSGYWFYRKGHVPGSVDPKQSPTLLPGGRNGTPSPPSPRRVDRTLEQGRDGSNAHYDNK